MFYRLFKINESLDYLFKHIFVLFEKKQNILLELFNEEAYTSNNNNPSTKKLIKECRQYINNIYSNKSKLHNNMNSTYTNTHDYINFINNIKILNDSLISQEKQGMLSSEIYHSPIVVESVVYPEFILKLEGEVDYFLKNNLFQYFSIRNSNNSKFQYDVEADVEEFIYKFNYMIEMIIKRIMEMLESHLSASVDYYNRSCVNIESNNDISSEFGSLKRNEDSESSKLNDLVNNSKVSENNMLVFLNGEYIGINSLKSKIKALFIHSYGVSESNIIIS